VSLAVLLNGCVSKSKAQAEAQRAYFAGQQAAIQRMQQEARGPNVKFLGQVVKAVIPWSDGLTLARAIVFAGYYAPTTPRAIIIHRKGQMIPIDVNGLVKGEDFAVEAGDIVELQP